MIMAVVSRSATLMATATRTSTSSISSDVTVLPRNRGDGTFEDVTQKAGVGLGDRVCVAAAFADTMNNGRRTCTSPAHARR